MFYSLPQYFNNSTPNLITKVAITVVAVTDILENYYFLRSIYSFQNHAHFSEFVIRAQAWSFVKWIAFTGIFIGLLPNTRKSMKLKLQSHLYFLMVLANFGFCLIFLFDQNWIGLYKLTIDVNFGVLLFQVFLVFWFRR
jgi:hypothetical protein